jgi:hypothetical protein
MTSHVYPTTNDVSTSSWQFRVQNGGTGACSKAAAYTVSDSATINTSQKYRYAAGHRTPGWRRLKNEGIILPMTAWDRIEIDVTSNGGLREWCNSSQSRKYYYVEHHLAKNAASVYPSIGSWQSYDWMAHVDSMDLQYYVQKAASAIYSSGWDASTFLAEIGQLRRMLSGVAKKLNNLIRGRSPGELHNLWLEGRYGWRTLMYDIQDLHGVLSRANERRTRYRETKGYTASGSYSTSSDFFSSLVSRYTFSYTWTANMRGTVVADIDVPDFQFNPITTLWEVTRLSFVVDWLINVGQALEAASFLLMVKDYKACTGYRIDFDVAGTCSLIAMAGGITDGALTGSIDGNVSLIKRTPATVSAFPRLNVRLDGFKVIDLLALIRQRV